MVVSGRQGREDGMSETQRNIIAGEVAAAVIGILAQHGITVDLPGMKVLVHNVERAQLPGDKPDEHNCVTYSAGGRETDPKIWFFIEETGI